MIFNPEDEDGNRLLFNINNDQTITPSGKHHNQPTLLAEGGYEVFAENNNTYRYNEKGLLALIATRVGNTTTFVRNEYLQVVEIQSHFGKKMMLEYNSEGLLDEVTEPMNREVSYQYDSVKRLASINKKDGSEVQYAYEFLEDELALTKVSQPDDSFRVYNYMVNNEKTVVDNELILEDSCKKQLVDSMMFLFFL